MYLLATARTLGFCAILASTGRTATFVLSADYRIKIKPVTGRPCLLMDPADIAAVKQRFEALPPATYSLGGSPVVAVPMHPVELKN